MKEQTYLKSVLRHLEDTRISTYLTSYQEKQKLGYPLHNQQCQLLTKQPQLVALDCQTIQTKNGQQLCHVLIMDSKPEVIFDQWFRPKHQIITSKENFESHDFQNFTKQTIIQIQKIIKGKAVIGHDLANHLKFLHINHRFFIDTVALFPHNFGLPLKNKLKDLALEHLGRPIQWHSHNSEQDMKAVLDLVTLCIKEGRGRMVEVETTIPTSHYTIEQLICQSELDINKIEGFFLRGSRAFQIQVNQEDYQSDWDYFCIYTTSTTIKGKLIKLHNTDITIYDSKTFYKYLNQSQDIPCIQLFYLPKECQFINKLKLPETQLGIVRESLGYHIGKCDRKIKRFKQTLQGAKRDWKLLKIYHLKLRFLDFFLQFHEKREIFDIKRSKPVWDKVREMYLNSNFAQAQKWILEQVRTYHEQVRKVHKSHRPLKRANQQMHYQKTFNQKQPQQKPAAKDEMIFLLKKYMINSSFDNINPLKLALVDELLKNGLSRMEQIKIGYQRHKLHPNLIQFHYLQSANFLNQICRESRGIILDQAQNYKVISLPYFKFFDYNDSKFSELPKFDFSSCKVYEKYDGSFAVLYHYKDQWWVSSTRFPDGGNNYCFARAETTIQFRLQFWNIFNKLGYKKPSKEYHHLTFIFEILSKDHIIVVRRQDSDLRLHGVINSQNGQQLDHLQFRDQYGWSCAQQIDLKVEKIEDVLEVVESLSPLKQEGFILRDKNNTRLKVKSKAYLRANWLAQLNLTPLKSPRKYILEQVVLSNGYEQFCNYCPEWKPMIDEILTKIKLLNQECKKAFEKVKNMNKKQRSFYIMNMQQAYRPFVFALCQDFEKWRDRLHFLMPPKKISAYLDKIGIN